VNELCSVLQLPQSTVSRHLKILGDEGWVTSRADGTSRRYRMTTSLEGGAKDLWKVVRQQLATAGVSAEDEERVRSVIELRRTRSQEFFSSAAGQWDSMRAELFGERADAMALLGLLPDDWTVGDLGCGTGQVIAALMPCVEKVIGVDASRGMLSAARRRLNGAENVELRLGELESLPIEDGELDAAVLFLVLHYVVEPAKALSEAARALKPGGRLLIVDMMLHTREEYRERMGHIWQGFPAELLDRWMSDAGLRELRYRALPADPKAKGPQLFAAVMKK
jgi:ubiquinone/menaquinone biosynthesis C-methylase UbiE